MQYLKQSTAKTLRFGPFLDETDGKTAEIALTISQADILLSKDGGAFAQSNDASGATKDASDNGWYYLQLNATDTATLGPLTVAIHESGALPVWREFMVVTANVYDTLCSTDILQSDLTQIGGVAQSATDLKDFADAGYDPATNKVQGVVLADTLTTYTGNTPQTGDSYALANGATGFAAIDTVVDSILEDTGTTLPATLTVIENYLDTEIAAILADTNELQGDWTNGGRLDLLVDAILEDTATTIPALARPTAWAASSSRSRSGGSAPGSPRCPGCAP